MIENQIRREDLAYRMAKALEIKGPVPTLSLDPTVLGVVLMEDLSGGNEQDFAVNRWCRGRGQSGAGAQFGKLSFNNHVDSGILVKVYQIDLFHDIAAAVGGEVGISIEGASAGGTQINFTKIFTDARLSFGTPGSPSRLPSVDIRSDNSGGIGTHAIRPFVPDPHLGYYHVNLNGYVLRPGSRLHMEGLDVAVQYTAHVEWTETNVCCPGGMTWFPSFKSMLARLWVSLRRAAAILLLRASAAVSPESDDSSDRPDSSRTDL